MDAGAAVNVKNVVGATELMPTSSAGQDGAVRVLL